MVGYGGVLVFLALAVAVGITMRGRRVTADALIAVSVPLGLALVAFCVSPRTGWASSPVWVLTALLGALALPTAFAVLRRKGRVLMACGLVVAVVPTLVAFQAGAVAFRAKPTVPMCLVAEPFGRAFNGYADVLGGPACAAARLRPRPLHAGPQR